MKGYLYLDIDNKLYIKSQEYIETEHPTFFADNSHYITKWWKFDTENLSVMRSILTQFKDYQLKMIDVTLILESINFDVSTLKGNASTVQSRPK